MILKNLFNLQLFAEENVQAAADVTTEAVSVDSGETSSDAAENNVETQKPSFDEMIKGEYKQDFDNKVQKILKQRVKNYDDLLGYKKNSEQLMGFLSERFGKKADDFGGILDAMRYDRAYIEAQAFKEGKDPDEYERGLKESYEKADLKFENESLKRQLQERENAEKDEQSRRLFNEDVEKVKSVYSDFDISEQMQNSDFVDLLRRGVPMQAAYEVVNRDKILSNAMHYTAQKVSEQVTNNIKARGARPTENGVSSQAASSVKTDVSNLTLKDINDIMKRVSRGEKITF